MFDIRHILVPSDLSDSAIRALRFSRLLAGRTGAHVTVMYTDPVVYPVDMMGQAPSLLVGPSPVHEEALRRELRAQAEPWLEELAFGTIVRVGQPLPMILAAAEECGADLIVMATRDHGGWRRAVLGSVTEGLLQESMIPVFTVSGIDRRPATDPFTITKIVCPTNFTDVSLDALRAASRLARLFAAQLVVVHVIEPGEVTDVTADEARVREWIAPELQNLSSYRELVLRGGPAERVLDCVEDLEASLLVIGAQHKLFRNAPVIGTTSERLIRFAPCPVLTIPRRVAKKLAEVRETARVTAG